MCGIVNRTGDQVRDFYDLIGRWILQPDYITFPQVLTLDNVTLLDDERTFLPFLITRFV